MNKFYKALRSRTVWTVVALFVVGGFESVQNLLPADAVKPLEVVLTLLAGYFRVNPKA